MHTNTIIIMSKNAFSPNTIGVIFRDENSKKDEIYNLTIYEAKLLIEQLNKTLEGIEQ